MALGGAAATRGWVGPLPSGRGGGGTGEFEVFPDQLGHHAICQAGQLDEAREGLFLIGVGGSTEIREGEATGHYWRVEIARREMKLLGSNMWEHVNRAWADCGVPSGSSCTAGCSGSLMFVSAVSFMYEFTARITLLRSSD